MTKLENIKAKLLEDAKKTADEIVEDAKKQADDKYEKEIKKYYLQAEQLKERAENEKNLSIERLKSGATLKIRNEKLASRQKVIDRVIQKLQEKLFNMNETEYLEYLERHINFETVGNKKIKVVEKYFNQTKERFPNLNLVENEFVSSGFILEENGIQENYTFEVKLDFMRDELEVEISKMLFS